jgi:DNA-binding NarL/FixJ family response regulator
MILTEHVAPVLKRLTEMRVLKLLIKGKNNRQIAHSLNRSNRTIEVHRANIMKKLVVDNIIDLIKRAALMGLIEFPNNHANHDILDDEQLASG